MSRAKLKVQNMILATAVKRYPSGRTRDLLAVEYFRSRPADIEFPVSLGNLDLFVRFSVFRAGQASFAIRMYRIAEEEEFVWEFGPYRVEFEDGSRVKEQPFRLTFVKVPLPGQYALKLCRKRSRFWKGSESQVLGNEYFETRGLS
jgi:hypothetical protein